MSLKPFCLMPWVHLHVGDRGMVKACCVANIPFGNINSDDFNAIWNDTPIQQLREKFAAGIPDPRCSVCLNREKGKAKSIRQETFEKFQDFDYQTAKLPVYFDIRFSNVCNFRCRTCWHGASSKWFQDARELGRAVGNKAIIENVSDFKLFIRKCGESLKGAKEIYFAGGEPLVTEEHYLLLDWLIENDIKPVLRYNTNFSRLRFKEWNVIERWRRFPEIEIMASVDGTEEHGEYIRKEFDWKVFLVNRESIKKEGHITFKIAPTVSVLNIFQLTDFYRQCLEMRIIEPEDWYINLLERPFYYNIQSLPFNQKEAVTKKLKADLEIFRGENLPDKIINAFQSCIDFMHVKDLSNHRKAFHKETEMIDNLRGEDYAKTGVYLK